MPFKMGAGRTYFGEFVDDEGWYIVVLLSGNQINYCNDEGDTFVDHI